MSLLWSSHFFLAHPPMPKPRHRTRVVERAGVQRVLAAARTCASGLFNGLSVQEAVSLLRAAVAGLGAAPEKPFAQVYPDPDGERDEKAIDALAARHAPTAPHAGPITLDVQAELLVPASWPAWEREAALAGRIRPTSKPDADNFAKSFADALTRGGRFWRDDAQVVELTARKVYAATAGWRIAVFAYSEPTRAEWAAEKAGQKQVEMFGRGA